MTLEQMLAFLLIWLVAMLAILGIVSINQDHDQ
jgi:hypothetical protein